MLTLPLALLPPLLPSPLLLPLLPLLLLLLPLLLLLQQQLLLPVGRRVGHRRSGSAGSIGSRTSPSQRSITLAPVASRSTLQLRHSMSQQATAAAAAAGTSAGSQAGGVEGLVGMVVGVVMEMWVLLCGVASVVGGLCKGLGGKVGLVGGVLMVVGVGHLLLMWRVVQLLGVLVEKLDAPASLTL
jgi:hypothetical protein